MLIPEKLINFRAYKNGTQYMGIANVDLPALQAMTTSIKGSGISGEIDSVVPGHFQSMQAKITFRTPTAESLSLTAPIAHEVEFRESIDSYENKTSESIVQPMKVWIKGKPKNTGLGKLEPGSTMDSEVELEVIAIGVWLDGKESVYIDKLNYICKVDGTDYLAAARTAEGMGG
ncbi:phage tail protein [Candidatus Saccharibacteria bacterium]|nr:phage tail protein [Candidatus Saccharibacteria bacterium]